LDFASLYPNIIIAYNICYTTLLHKSNESVPDADCNIIEFDQDEIINEKPVKNHYKFKFNKNQEGLLPKLVRTLVSERRAINRQIVQIKEDTKFLEKTEDILTMLGNYLNGTSVFVPIDILLEKINVIGNSNPELLANTKKQLIISQIFNLSYMTSKKESNPPNILIDLEYKISLLYNNNDKQGLIDLCTELKTSQITRKSEIDNNKILLIVLDKRQLAIKVSANSFFGFLGVQTGGKLPLIEGAMSITAKGRELIGDVRKFIEDKYQGKQIYGDTDSVMMHIPHIKDSKECNYWGNKLAQDISGIKPGEKDCDGILWVDGRKGLFPPPLTMEFEKAMRLLCLKKKKYVALLINKDGKFKTEEVTDKYGNVDVKNVKLTKGVVLARRDNCNFLRETYTTILDIILNNKGLVKAINALCDAVENLLSNKVNPKELVIIRALGGNYKSENYFMKIFSDNLRQQGKIVNSGDRLDYVIIKNSDTNSLLGNNMRLFELFNPDIEQIDYNYYIDKQLMHPIDQLFEVGFKNDLTKLTHVSYKASNRQKEINLSQPLLMIYRMLENGYTIGKFREAVLFNINKVINPPVLTLNINKVINPPVLTLNIIGK
jgi:DNA polymerase elongation subunit (family B)